MPENSSSTLRSDLSSGIVVALVALPLCLGIVLASGAPIVAGLIAAVDGGVVTGLLAGSPLQVSGPAAGLTVVVAGVVGKFGWETMCLITQPRPWSNSLVYHPQSLNKI